MWTRKELKERAKAAFSQGYWKLVLVGLIASVISGGSGGSDSSYEFESSESIPPSYLSELIAMLPLIAGITLAILIVAILVGVFVISPLEVGTSRFFLMSLNEDTPIRDVLYAFDNGYMNAVKILFMRNLKTFLWSLLLIIPGIVKAYEYRMIPYLLAENPELTSEEAFRLSRELMDGQKLDAFILDLSFIGWHILSACTFGLVAIFYVNPYEALTDAALYDTLSANHGHPARWSSSQQTWNNTYTGYGEV